MVQSPQIVHETMIKTRFRGTENIPPSTSKLLSFFYFTSSLTTCQYVI